MVHPSFAPRVHVWAVLRMLRHVYNLNALVVMGLCTGDACA